MDSDLGNNVIVIYRIKLFLEGYGGKFIVDILIGELCIIVNFDCEVEEFYLVKVIVEDRGFFLLEVIVNIIIQDKNDNVLIFIRRIYLIEVFENFVVGGVFLLVIVYDVDKGLNVWIFYSIDMNLLDGVIVNEYFLMNFILGDIIFIKQFDRELYVNILMLVIVIDGGIFVQFFNLMVIIFIEDINDNRFIFLFLFYNVEVFYEFVCDYVIIMVIVYDKDLEKNVEVVYEMDLIYGENQFLLDLELGNLKELLNFNLEIYLIFLWFFV